MLALKIEIELGSISGLAVKKLGGYRGEEDSEVISSHYWANDIARTLLNELSRSTL